MGGLVALAPGYLGVEGSWRLAFLIPGGSLGLIALVGTAIEVGSLTRSDAWRIAGEDVIPAIVLILLATILAGTDAILELATGLSVAMRGAALLVALFCALWPCTWIRSPCCCKSIRKAAPDG